MFFLSVLLETKIFLRTCCKIKRGKRNRERKRVTGGHPSARKAAMKRCALCHGRLGLGTRFRNIWNGRWWVHVRFCSARCEGVYEVRQNEAAKHRWHTFLAHSNSRRSGWA